MPSKSQINSRNNLVLRANEALEAQNYDEAIKLYTKAANTTLEFAKRNPSKPNVAKKYRDEVELLINRIQEIKHLQSESKPVTQNVETNKTHNNITISDMPKHNLPINDKFDIDVYLKDMVGLTHVKQQLKELQANVYENRNNLNVIKNFHMVFTGNPGTGKTQVAKMLGEFFKETGILKTNKVTEVTSKDLVAGYKGQSGEKANKVIQEALDGVLFIDEAYGLHEKDSRGGDYNAAVVEALLQAMETYQDRLVVIFAGYYHLMREFLREGNPGLESRLYAKVHFDDYSNYELIEIFKIKNRLSYNYEITEGAISELDRLISLRRELDAENFGNARLATNLLVKAVSKSAYRRFNTNTTDTETKTIEDVDIIEALKDLEREARLEERLVLNK